MGMQADHDLWGQALAAERRYGDLGPEVLAQQVPKLVEAGEYREAEFWSQVAACLSELHTIRFPGDPTRSKATAAAASPPVAENHRGRPGLNADR